MHGIFNIFKKAEVFLNKIKSFIFIDKKPKIIQTDNGLEFKNHLLSVFLENEGIVHIYSRVHYTQTNGCLERYHKEVKKFIKEN